MSSISWTSTVGGNWNTAANWDTAVVPANGDSLVFGAAGSKGATLNNNGQNIPLPQEICKGPGCPVSGQTPMNRITSKVTGPKNTVSYVQAFVY